MRKLLDIMSLDWLIPIRHQQHVCYYYSMITNVKQLRNVLKVAEYSMSGNDIQCQSMPCYTIVSLQRRIMSAMASKITSLTIVSPTVYSGAHQREHQSSASLAFVRGIHRWPVNSSQKGPITRIMIPFDDGIMSACKILHSIWYLASIQPPLLRVACQIANR